jgi:hypothetical protein
MTYRHFLGASALVTSVAISGCANKPQQHRAPGETEQPPTERYSQLAQTDGPTTQPVTGHTDLNLGSAKTEDILAQKTAAYAEEVDRLLKARAAEKAAAAAPTTKPVAKSEVTFVEPRQLPPVTNTPTPQAKGQAVAQAPAASPEKKPTIHQLLETAPAAANQATKIPVGNEQVAVAPAPAIDLRAQSPQAQQAARPQPLDETTSSDALARKLAERIKSDPLDVAAQLDYQLLQMLRDQTVPELNAIAPLPQEDREIVSAVMDGLSNFRNTVRTGGNALLGQKTGPLVEMGDRVRNQTSLGIPTLVLCRDVRQFGVYEPFTSTRFPFGAKHLVVVYCEVANFATQMNAKQLWETKLKYEVLLYTDSSETSLQVWQQKPTPVVDQSHSRRRDFFIAKLVELPQDLPVGGYLLKVSLVDETANRIAEATVPLQIVAK